MAEQHKSNEILLLQDQLKQKTKELAKLANQIDEKTRIIESIREQLDLLLKKPESLSWRATEIYKILDTANRASGDTFIFQMDELNQEFYKNLKSGFPDLSTGDLRLCAYIKIGLDSKEVANLMNIKPSSIYISRFRLRKKLGLTADDDLYGFLTTI